MGRGDLIVAIMPGDYGKPRPALIIQSDLYAAHTSFAVLPLTSDLRANLSFRIDIAPDAVNGLKAISQVMVDKPHTVPREKALGSIGRLTDADFARVERSLALFLGFG